MSPPNRVGAQVWARDDDDTFDDLVAYSMTDPRSFGSVARVGKTIKPSDTLIEDSSALRKRMSCDATAATHRGADTPVLLKGSRQLESTSLLDATDNQTSKPASVESTSSRTYTIRQREQRNHVVSGVIKNRVGYCVIQLRWLLMAVSGC